MMPYQHPFKRTIRQFTDGSYDNSGQSTYLLNQNFANNPQLFVRSFILLQEEFKSILNFIEPSDDNLATYSIKNIELLIMICVEIEANFTAILQENTYSRSSGSMNIRDDYSLLEHSHNLSEYEIAFPIWKGRVKIIKPFENWANFPGHDWHTLEWYKAYNSVKHDRYNNMHKATFENVANAIAGLVALLSAQFHTEDFLPNAKALVGCGDYSFGYMAKYDDAIGGYFRVKFPDNGIAGNQYDFSAYTGDLKVIPVNQINFNSIRASSIAGTRPSTLL